MAYKDNASVLYVQFKGCKTHSRGCDNDIVAEHNVKIRYTVRVLWIRPVTLRLCEN